MALVSRITKLERTARSRSPAPCRACGAPAGWVPSLRMTNEEGVDLGPTCAACSFPLMSNGKAVYALPPGSEQKRIILDRAPYGIWDES